MSRTSSERLMYVQFTSCVTVYRNSLSYHQVNDSSDYPFSAYPMRYLVLQYQSFRIFLKWSSVISSFDVFTFEGLWFLPFSSWFQISFLRCILFSFQPSSCYSDSALANNIWVKVRNSLITFSTISMTNYL